MAANASHLDLHCFLLIWMFALLVMFKVVMLGMQVVKNSHPFDLAFVALFALSIIRFLQYFDD